MPLSTGTRLGPYEVLAPLGAGGMGEVYRARDTRLNRDVALKILPPAFADDASRMARFEREAQVLASLNHPKIAAIYAIEAGAIVMELVPGQTLEEKIAAGPLPVDEALAIARQIAEALEAAHEKGVVHRDLKPANVKITPDGIVKVLDFGLAKATEAAPAPAAASPTQSPTLSLEMTRAGAILGTAAYMSPEQARGKAVDRRADIWAFGVVLYEMLTGRRAFRGETATDVLAAVVNQDPDLTPVPAKLHRLLRACFQKDPKQRLQSIGDWQLLPEDDPVVRAPATRVRWRWFAGVAVVALVATLARAWLERTFFGHPAPAAFSRLTFENGTVYRARFAPDGRTVVYNAAWNGGAPNVFSVRIGEQGSTEHGLPNSLLFSLSSTGEMALRQGTSAILTNHFGTLARVPLSGGAPRAIIDAVADADWEPNGERLAVVHWVNGATRLEYPLGHVLYESAGSIDFPRISPSGDRIVLADHPVVDDDRGSIVVVDLAGKKTTLSSGWSSVEGVAWAPSGNEVWFAAATKGWADTLWAVTLTGKQRDLFQSPSQMVLFDAGMGGRALIDSRSKRDEMFGFRDGETKEQNLTWLDGSFPVDLSSDGVTLLFREVGGALNYYVGLRKTDGSPVIRLGDGSPSSLSSDGKWVLAQILTTPPQLELIPTGAGEIQRLPQIGLSYQEGGQWFPDTKRIMFAAGEPGHGNRLWVQDVFPPGKPRPFTPEGVLLHGNSISPDGKMVAASSQDGGLSLYPIDGETPHPVRGIETNDRFVRWSGDGKHIFVFTSEGVQALIYKIEIETGRREKMRELTPSDPSGLRLTSYQVVMTPDGKSGVYSFSRVLSKLQLVEGLR